MKSRYNLHLFESRPYSSKAFCFWSFILIPKPSFNVRVQSKRLRSKKKALKLQKAGDIFLIDKLDKFSIKNLENKGKV